MIGVENPQFITNWKCILRITAQQTDKHTQTYSNYLPSVLEAKKPKLRWDLRTPLHSYEWGSLQKEAISSIFLVLGSGTLRNLLHSTSNQPPHGHSSTETEDLSRLNAPPELRPTLLSYANWGCLPIFLGVPAFLLPPPPLAHLFYQTLQNKCKLPHPAYAHIPDPLSARSCNRPTLCVPVCALQ